MFNTTLKTKTVTLYYRVHKIAYGFGAWS